MSGSELPFDRRRRDAADEMRRIDVAERRARVSRRHFPTTTSVDDLVRVAGSLVGLHSSDPATVYLSLWARVPGFVPDHLERLLYERRTLVRMLGMRRTMFVVPLDLAGVMNAACTVALAPAERRRLIRLIEEQDLASDGAAWLAGVEGRTLAAMAERGEATAAELKEDVAELAESLAFGAGKKWEGSVGMSTRTLFLLATEARIVRGRPLGTWRSSQYRWARLDDWLPKGLEVWDPRLARAELVRRWLETFGPAPFDDVKWWTPGRPWRTRRRQRWSWKAPRDTC